MPWCFFGNEAYIWSLQICYYHIRNIITAGYVSKNAVFPNSGARKLFNDVDKKLFFASGKRYSNSVVAQFMAFSIQINSVLSQP